MLLLVGCWGGDLSWNFLTIIPRCAKNSEATVPDQVVICILVDLSPEMVNVSLPPPPL